MASEYQLTRRNLAMFAAAALVTFGVYLSTLYPDVGPTDSGELTVAAWTLGTAHPPGFPAYVLLGWLWSHLLAAGSVAWRLNLFSACCATLSVFLVACSATLLSRRSGCSARMSTGAGSIAALIFGLGKVFWWSATLAEVYALNTALLAGLLLVLLGGPPVRRSLVAGGLLFGLGLGVHPVCTLFFAPMLVAWLWPDRTAPATQRASAAALFAATAGAVLTTLYVFVWLRAQQDPPLNWGNPETLQRLWWHITAAQYQAFLATEPWTRWLGLVGESLWLWTAETYLVGLGLGLWGWARASLETRRWLFGGLGLLLATLVYTASYDIAQDREAYHLPLFMLTAVGAGPALATLLQRGGRQAWPIRAFLGLFIIGLAAASWRLNDHSSDYSPARGAEQSLGDLAPNALVLTTDWELYSPALYKQSVERLRNDLIIIDLLLWKNRPWYVDQVAVRHPELTVSWQPPLDGFLRELYEFEAGRLRATGRIRYLYRQLLERMTNTPDRAVYLDRGSLPHFQEHGATPGGKPVEHGRFLQVVR